jgi:hypothetical protein
VPAAGVLAALLAVGACGSEPRSDSQDPPRNAVVRGVHTMTGSIDRSREAADAVNQRNAGTAAAANALD